MFLFVCILQFRNINSLKITFQFKLRLQSLRYWFTILPILLKKKKHEGKQSFGNQPNQSNIAFKIPFDLKENISEFRSDLEYI